MKKRKIAVEKRKVTLFEKMKIALHMLLIQKRAIPGAKGWELKKVIGSKYPYIINMLDKELNDFGLKIKIVFPEDIKDPSNPTKEDYDRSHFYIITSEPVLNLGIKGKFNIEELGCLSACILYIITKSNLVSLKELKEFLSKKISQTKSKIYIEKFRKHGYIHINEENMVSLGWRTKAEIDIEALIKLLAIYSI